MRFGKRGMLATGMTALSFALAACSTMGSTPYQPLSATSPAAGGFSEMRIAPDQYRVTFAGNRLTSRETVESYLLYRAAELTVEQGYDWFAIVDREVEHRVDRSTYPDPRYDPWFAPDYVYWRPYWRYYAPGTGWNSWYPYYGDPFWANRVQSQTVERFEATAEIHMGHGAMPATNVRAFDARDVIARIGPDIRRPRD
ncbi:CC0125/CC1285 family lipoprotein [Novosphingobium malaysiense]|nr:hypothetical protein [Novosphingobium malaysiense]